MELQASHQDSGQGLRGRLPAVGDVAFFAFVLVYAYVGVDSRLIYHGQSLGFSTMPGFAREIMFYPGGVCDYLNRLMGQTYTVQWLGAIMLAAQAVLVAWVTHEYFRVLAGRPVPVLRYIPAGLLMMYQSFYHESLAIVLWVAIGVGLASVFIRISRRVRSELWLLVIFEAMVLPTFCLFGRASIFFAMAAAVAQICRRPRLPLGIVYPVFAFGQPLGVQHWFFPEHDIYKEWLAHAAPELEIITNAMYLFYPVATAAVIYRAALGRAGRWLVAKLSKSSAATVNGPRQPRPGEKQLAAVLSVTFLLLGAGAIAGLSHRASGPMRRALLMDFCCWRGQWADVLEQGRTIPLEEYNPIICYEVNLALHESGRMGDEMFAYPQRGVVMLNLRDEGSPPYMMLLSDMCLRLGRVNDAEHFVSETYAMVTNEPRVLDLMSKIYLVKGQTAVARKVLTVMSYDLTYGSEARRRLKALDEDPECKGDAEIGLYRRRMLRQDDLDAVSKGNIAPLNVEQLLEDQLKHDPSNRMAFEFLMAMYLDLQQLDRARKLMGSIKNMTGPSYVTAEGLRRTPKVYQEAMVALADGTGSPHIDGVKIDSDTLRRSAAMRQIASRMPDAQTQYQSLWQDYRHSYFFFLLFGPGDYR